MKHRVNVLLEERHAWAWVDDSLIPKWHITIGHINRTARRWRMVNDLIRAYVEMLSGQGRSVSSVLLAGGDAHVAVERLSYSVEVTSVRMLEEALTEHTGDTNKVHTPFLARREVAWDQDPHTECEDHVFVDASFFPDGPGGVPVSCYSILTMDGLVTHDLSSALTSVEAEVLALQHALFVAHNRAQRTGRAHYVFSDCTAAIIKVILRKEVRGLDLLGEHVYVQWSPGHYKAAPGMVLVDQSARARVRELAAD